MSKKRSYQKLRIDKKIKAVIALFGLIIIIFGLFSFLNTFSEHVTDSTIWDGTFSNSFSYGDGTQTNPYLITSARELALLSERVDNGSTYDGSYFILTNDIDLNNIAWEPIGDRDNSFRGVFDGAGHKITNLRIDTQTAIPNYNAGILSYGLFASLGGAGESTIKNLVIDGAVVNLNNVRGSSSTNTGYNYGYNIGTVVGSMYLGAKVENVIVKNTMYNQNNTLTPRSRTFQFFIGGIAGYAVNALNNNSDPGAGNRYVIDNCYADVDFDLNINRSGSRYYYYLSQTSIGGIIGGIRGQAVYPTNSLYNGYINVDYGFVGPILGQLRSANSSLQNNTNNFLNVYSGDEAGSVANITSSYSNYEVNGTYFYYNTTLGNSLMDSVMGVNKGNYTAISYQTLDNFNANSYDGIEWNYTNGNFDMYPRLTGTITENPNYTFRYNITDHYYVAGTTNYDTVWLIDGEVTDVPNNILTMPAPLDHDIEIIITSSDGSYKTVNKFTVPKVEFELILTHNPNSDTITATIGGTGGPYYQSQYGVFTWYKEDISGDNTELLTTTTNVLTNVDSFYEYRCIFTYTQAPSIGLESYVNIQDKEVVYVDYAYGDDDNSGYYPDDAVKNMQKAYSLLNSNYGVGQNIIVIIGSYSSQSNFMYVSKTDLNARTALFNKKATLTGKYRNIDYEARLNSNTTDNGNYSSFIFNDTTFQYLNFYGSGNSGMLYLTVQNFNLVMGEGLTMTNYGISSASSNALASGTAPNVHILGGYADYNGTPSIRDGGSITIKSGTYARIVSGTRNTTTNNNSHNITGSATKHFVQNITVDIQNSTTNTATYGHDINLIVGGQTDGSIYADTTIRVESGNIGRIIGGSIGYNRTINGYPSNMYIGSSTITINGGVIDELFGGSLGRLQKDVYYYGPIKININGGVINNNIYGAGAGGVSGYHPNNSDSYNHYAINTETSTEITISGGTINGDVYGAGYGYSEYLTANQIAVDGGGLYGNSSIIITGGTITGSIYGAGRGSNVYSGKEMLGSMIGNTYISVSENANIGGGIYGAGQGNTTYVNSAKLTGNSTIVIDKSLNCNIYGGGENGLMIGNSKINIDSGTQQQNIYGGGKEGDITGNSEIELQNGNYENVFGGGQSASVTNSKITLISGSASNIYGGSYTAGNVSTTNVLINGGDVDYVYGGTLGAAGSSGSNHVTINGGAVNNQVYGGGSAASSTSTLVDLLSVNGRIPEVYGGGQSANANSTVININAINAGNVFGGSNTLGNVQTSIIEVNNGANIDNLYGGNNVNGKTNNTTINVDPGTSIDNLFGGGKATDCDITNVNFTGGTAGIIYGGSESSGNITTTNVMATGGSANQIFGGNKQGTSQVSTTNVTINGTRVNEAVYGGGFAAPVGDTFVRIVSFPGAIPFVYGGGESASANATSIIYENGSSDYIFGGSNAAGNVASTYINVLNGTIDSVFGGNNSGGDVTISNVNIAGGAINTVYGGNNEDDETITTGVNITGGNVDYVYGGGFAAPSGTTNVLITDSNIGNGVYGGGENAGVINSTTVNIINSNINGIGNVFGGGDNGPVGTTTNLTINNSRIYGSVYAGGNGATAIVSGNTSLTMTATSTVGGNIFGGGNAAQSNGNTTVDLTGVTIQGSLYGGGNDAGVLGSTEVNFNNSHVLNDIFGGGNNGAVGGNTNVAITTGDIDGTLYAGGNGATAIVSGSTILTSIGATNVAEDIFGGGNAALTGTAGDATKGNTTVNLNGITIEGSLYGGGKQAAVTGSTEVELKNFNITNDIFGGGDNGAVNGDTNVAIDTGNIGGTIYAGGNGATAIVGGNATVTSIGTTVVAEDVFGGGNAALTGTAGDQTKGNTTVNLNGITIRGSLYGGGNDAGVTGSTDVVLTNISIINDIFGGGNNGAVGANTNIAINTGDIDGTIYAGGNGTTAVVSGNTTVTSIGETTVAENVFGGGNAALTMGNTTVNLEDISISGGLYGGGQQAGVGGSTDVDLISSTVTLNAFGGGDFGAVDNNTNLLISDSTISLNVFAGGNGATATVGGNTILNINNTSVIELDVFGGGNAALTGTNNQPATGMTDVTLSGITIRGSLYGGGKQADVTGNTNIDASYITISGNVFGGGDFGAVNGGTDLILNNTTVSQSVYAGGNGLTATVSGNTRLETSEDTIITGNVFGGGNAAQTGSSLLTGNTVVVLDDTSISGGLYGGGKEASVTGSTNIDVLNSSINLNVFGGGDNGAVNGGTDVYLNNTTVAKTVYAGGNGLTAIVDGNTTLLINNNSIITEDVFGGGNAAQTGVSTQSGNTNVTLDDITVHMSVYGGGKQANVTGSTDVEISDSSIGLYIFGGGDNGEVGANTNLYVSSTSVGKSIYAGGNGAPAIVNGNTTLNIDGTTTVVNHVFGGGNAAQTGRINTNNSVGSLNIVGATIGGNVYGAANTSVLYGLVNVKIGENAVNNNSLIPGVIDIGGTVFGGGEANESGSEEYDFSFISVTTGITINIDGSDHTTFNIGGSIFGSGNASSTTGYSRIYIKNYGNNGYKRNVSIQRADLLSISNSVIELIGATDRTNEYSSELFTLSRIGELKLKNNSTMYLQTGSNLLQKFTSAVDINGTETKAIATIAANGDVTRNVNNRIYMYEGKILNIATNEAVTTYGTVDGMTFFGLYNHDRNGDPTSAFYDSSFNNGDTVENSDLYYFSDGSYVLGSHIINHNIRVDGFYTNEKDELQDGKIKTVYIEPTPADSNYYMWVVGELVASYEVNLVASKYSTLGAYELPLLNYSAANTSFTVMGFNYNDLDSNVSLVNNNSIPRIAPNSDVADNVMSLAMKTSNTGWITIGSTLFMSDEDSPVTGTRDYYTENSTVVPSLFFYLYHSKNLATEGNMGSVTISLLAITPIDDLTNQTERLNITVNLSRALYNTNDYEAAISSGKQYSLFSSSATNINSTSSISTYYSLYAESQNSIYGNGYHRSLVSSFVLPAGTKITMIDLARTNPDYYYYVVSPADVIGANLEFENIGECSYNLSKFVKMGSSSLDNIYDEAEKNTQYYDSVNHRAEEEFIFIVDYGESNFTTDVLEASLLIELRDSGGQTIIGVLGVQRGGMAYNIYYDEPAVIEVNARLGKSTMYVGERNNLIISTHYLQGLANGTNITDTSFFNQKLGIKISLTDSDNRPVDGYSLMGVSFELNGIRYYPRTDGSYRINLAERIANVQSNLIIHTENSNLASGQYHILIESFGSSDGIYYGLNASDSVSVTLNVINAIYGLNFTIPENEMIIENETGLNLNNNNNLQMNISYSSGLSNPNFHISLYRRDYETIDSLNYNLVDINEYFIEELTSTVVTNEYLLSTINNSAYTFHFNENLVTGTYKIRLSLYDNDSFIGEVERFIFIK